jgi:X-Pro dipeptidyl-peptidase
MKLMNRWFTHYLHGVDNGVEQDPRSWIVREDADREKPTSYDEYPNPQAEAVQLFVSAGAPELGSLALERSSKQGTERLVDNFSFSGAALAQAEWTEHRLIYVSPKLSKPIHISGTPRISIRLASNKPAANLSVWLVSLPWTEGKKVKITDNIITRGWADPQNHRSLTESEPLKPGQFYDLSFNLQPDDQIIPKGQQVGLMIFSSDRDFTLRPTPGTELTVDLDETLITLPVVGGKDALRESFSPTKGED